MFDVSLYVCVCVLDSLRKTSATDLAYPPLNQISRWNPMNYFFERKAALHSTGVLQIETENKKKPLTAGLVGDLWSSIVSTHGKDNDPMLAPAVHHSDSWVVRILRCRVFLVTKFIDVLLFLWQSRQVDFFFFLSFFLSSQITSFLRNGSQTDIRKFIFTHNSTKFLKIFNSCLWLVWGMKN